MFGSLLILLALVLDLVFGFNMGRNWCEIANFRDFGLSWFWIYCFVYFDFISCLVGC